MQRQMIFRLGFRLILSCVIIGVIVHQILIEDYHYAVMGCIPLVLTWLIPFLTYKFALRFPIALEMLILLFIFMAEILGEIYSFYIRIPVWDSILHIVKGIFVTAIGFSLVDLFHRQKNISRSLSPYFIAFTALCFSMTVGVVWEFCEFGLDCIFKTDTQKDWIVTSVNSVMLNPNGENTAVHIPVYSLAVNGEEWMIGGYLDIGLIDTMKDLLVSFLSSTIYAVIGIRYLKKDRKGKIASRLIPVVQERQ